MKTNRTRTAASHSTSNALPSHVVSRVVFLLNENNRHAKKVSGIDIEPVVPLRPLLDKVKYEDLDSRTARVTVADCLNSLNDTQSLTPILSRYTDTQWANLEAEWDKTASVTLGKGLSDPRLRFSVLCAVKQLEPVVYR